MTTRQWQDRPKRLSNPPTRAERIDFFGRNAFAVNRKIFETYMWETPLLDRMVWYVIQGQMPSIRNRRFKIGKRDYDNRVHATAFLDSGSGKAGFTEYAGVLATACGLNFYILEDCTDTALAGRRHQLPEYNPDTQRVETITKEEVGCLNPNHDPPINIIHYNEADALFDKRKSEWAKNIMSKFQKTMNTYKSFDNLITRDTSLGRIEFHTSVSILIASKPPAQFFNVITDTGFLQRTIMDSISANWEKKKSIDLKTLKMFVEYDEIDKDDEVSIGDVSLVMSAINKYWKGKKPIEVDKDAGEILLEEVYFALHDPLEKMTPFAQKTLSQFVSRWQEQIINLSYHNCYSRLGSSISVQDVADSKNFILPMWRNVIFTIEEGLTEPRDEKHKWRKQLQFIIDITEGLAKQYKKKGWVPRNALVKMLSSKTHGFGINPETARKRITRAEEEGYLERKSTKGSPIVRITDKPKNI